MNHVLLDYEQIRQVLNNYARACDQRDWRLFDQVFIEDVEFNYGGEYSAKGRDKLVKLIRNSLGGCGPTQHLLGNFSIVVDGDKATCSCYVRAFHVGLGAKKNQQYEVWGEYKDVLQKTDGAWKICNRKMLITYELGSRDVLAPEIIK
jgi:3-phenylpropionate/cinnamic acid dioxygenase small subunit